MDLQRPRAGIEQKFYDLCSQVIGQQHGLKLYDLEYITGQHLLRVFIMNESTKSATLDDCVVVDHALTPYLDEGTWIPETLTLEVSSPGVYRGLKSLEHFQMVLGEMVKLELIQRLEEKDFPGLPNWAKGQKKVRGLLKNASPEGIVVDLGQKEFSFKFSELKKANLDPEIGKNMRV